MKPQTNLALIDLEVTIRVDAAYGADWSIGTAMDQVGSEAVEKTRSRLRDILVRDVIVKNIALTTNEVRLAPSKDYPQPKAEVSDQNIATRRLLQVVLDMLTNPNFELQMAEREEAKKRGDHVYDPPSKFRVEALAVEAAWRAASEAQRMLFEAATLPHSLAAESGQ